MSEFALIVFQYELRHVSCRNFIVYKIVFKCVMDLLPTSDFQSPFYFFFSCYVRTQSSCGGVVIQFEISQMWANLKNLYSLTQNTFFYVRILESLLSVT